MEMFVIFGNSFQLYLILKLKDRRPEADRMEVAVKNGTFAPSVDIFIPTYSEPVFILRRAIIGCQAIDYPHKNIYLLDDTSRPEMKQLAKELGCEYMTRPDNRHAKAGNLNHALRHTSGELIVVFDADFVPSKNFLNRTVGFFQTEKIALIQTHQSFYNADPVARNLGLEKIVPQEVEIFSRHYQLLRDGVETALCYGSSFVVRRSALEETGGFFTDSLSEDYFTSIRLSANGYRSIYLGESLSAGLCAENMAGHVSQRLRWARGTLQAFFIQTNPLTIPGLSFIQRLAHFEGVSQWFTSVFRLIFLLMPLAYSFLGVVPLNTSVQEWLYFFLPYYLVQLFTFSWLNYRSRSALLSDIYAVAQCFPVAITVIHTMLSPFAKGFKVTPKGLSSDRFYFNWDLAWPLIILFVGTAASLWHNLSSEFLTHTPVVEGMRLGWIWSAYNLMTIAIALLILVDVPKPDPYDWFDLRRLVRISAKNATVSHRSAIAVGSQIASGDRMSYRPLTPSISDSPLWGITTAISEGGAQVTLTQWPKETQWPKDMLLFDKMPVTLEILEEGITLKGQITRTEVTGESSTVHVMFDELTLAQHRQLVEMLFCRPGQWKRQETPGELRSLWLLFRVLLKPRVLFDRRSQICAIAVSQN